MSKISTLFPLEPIGLESPFCESLSSYLARLARAHLLYIFILLKEIIVPLLNKRYLHDTFPIPHRLSSKWFSEIAVQINSLNSSTEVWVNILESLTNRSELSSLTMLPWKGRLAYRALIKLSQAWCPLCYKEMRANDIPFHNPLIWIIRGVESCILHKCILVENCPYCQKAVPILSQRACNSFCPCCFMWLGDIDLYPTIQPSSETQNSFAQHVGELIANSQKMRTVSPDIFGETIEEIIEHCFDSNALAFARYINVHHKTAYLWRDGGQVPQLSNLINLAQQFNTSPYRLLSGLALNNINTLPTANLATVVHPPRKHKKYRRFNPHVVETELNKVLENFDNEPLSMSQVAQKLGYDHSFLIRKFPDTTQKISKAYEAFRTNLSELQEKAETTELEGFMRHLASQNIYPSHRRLRGQFGGKLRDGRLRIFRKHFLKQLGY